MGPITKFGELKEKQLEKLRAMKSVLLSGDGEGLTVKFGELGLDMKYNEETTSTEWTEGAEMKTYTWRTGPNTIRIRNMVEDNGIVETSDLQFLPNGVSISKVVTKGFQSAHQLEWYERVGEDGKAKTLMLGWI